MYANFSISDSDGLEIHAVEHLPEYVIGFPIYVAVTIQAAPNTVFSRLVFADFLNLKSCIGIDAQSSGHSVRFMPKPFIEPEMGRHPQKLEPGESRRMLVDVSSLLTDIKPGEYRVRFSYLAPDIALHAAPVVIRFRNAVPAEEVVKASLASDRTHFDSWALWSLQCPNAPIPGDQLKQADPFTFPLLLRYLFCGSGPLQQIDPATLDILNGLYAPERDALKAELFRIRGDETTYTRLRTAILSKTPGLLWWMRELDADGAYLASFSNRPK